MDEKVKEFLGVLFIILAGVYLLWMSYNMIAKYIPGETFQHYRCLQLMEEYPSEYSICIVSYRCRPNKDMRIFSIPGGYLWVTKALCGKYQAHKEYYWRKAAARRQ